MAIKLLRDTNAYEDENFAIHIRTSTYETPFSSRRPLATVAGASITPTTNKSKLGRKGSNCMLEVPNGVINSPTAKSISGLSSISSSPTLCMSGGGIDGAGSPDTMCGTPPISIPGITCFPSTVAAAAAAAAATNGTKLSLHSDAISPTSIMSPGRTIVCEKSQALTLTGQALRLAPIHALRAAAFLYEHIHCARSQSINFAIPWQSLESRSSSTITTLKDYQDVIMGDIGKALEMMTEIVEQEHRPLGHPDNRERDTKQMFGPRSFVAIYPPESQSDSRGGQGSSSSKQGHHHSQTSVYQEFCGSSMGSLVNSPSSPAPLASSNLGSTSPFADQSTSNLDLHNNGPYTAASPVGSFVDPFTGGGSGDGRSTATVTSSGGSGSGIGHDSGVGSASRRRSKSAGRFLSVPYATNTHSRLYQQRQSRDSGVSGSGSSLTKSNSKSKRLSFWKVGNVGGQEGRYHRGSLSSSGDTLQDPDEKSTFGSTISFGGNGSGIGGQRWRRSDSDNNMLNAQSTTTSRSKLSTGDAKDLSLVSDASSRHLPPAPTPQQYPHKGEVLASLQKFLNVLIKPVKFGSSNESLSQGGGGAGGNRHAGSGAVGIGGLVGDGSSPTGSVGVFGRGSRGRDLEAAWRDDIQKRRRSLLAWCVRRFISLFRYSLTTEDCTMAPDFGHIYNLFIAIPDLRDEFGQPFTAVTETDGYFEQRLSLSKKKYSTRVPTIRGINKRFGLLNGDGEDPNATTHQHHHLHNATGSAPGSATGGMSYRFSATSPEATGLCPRPRTRTRTCSNSKETVSIVAATPPAGGRAAITLVSSPTDSSIASHASFASESSSISSSTNTSASRSSSDSDGSNTTASEDHYTDSSSILLKQQQRDHGKDDTSSVGSKKSHLTRPSLRIDTRTTRLLQQQQRQHEQQKLQQKQQQSQQPQTQAQAQAPPPQQSQQPLQQQQEDQPTQPSTTTCNSKPLQNHFIQHQQQMQQQQYPYGLDQRASIHHQRQASTASKLDTYTVHNHAAPTVHARWSFYGGVGLGGSVGILEDNHGLNGFDNMEYFGLRELSIWEPFFDRVTRLESDLTNLLSERSVYQFLRRFHINKSGMAQLSGSKKSEMLCVLDLIERCVLERRDNDQCQTWFRMSSSAAAVKQLADTGIHDFLTMYEGRNIVDEVNPVTLTGYFKRLLKEAGGLFCREVIELVIEIVSPTSLALDGDTESWFCKSIDIVSKRIVQRLMLMDVDRAEVLYRLTAVLAKILRHSNRDLELESVALTKMIQVTELESISELATLGKWNGYWSCIISGDNEQQQD
ncbi:hypothetical protein DFQ26_003175 [Actinomortierella ambigua]|nr:hypothetical protein DFQ26_003175 [Actinomortierella ambigua]